MGGTEIEFYASGSGSCWWCLFISDSIQTVQKNREASVVISKKASQAVSADRTKCVYMSCEQNAGQNYKGKRGNKYCENVKFRPSGATATNQNYILEHTKNKLNSRNALYVSGQNILFSICCPNV